MLMPFEEFDPPSMRLSIQLPSKFPEGSVIELPSQTSFLPDTKQSQRKRTLLRDGSCAKTESVRLTSCPFPCLERVEVIDHLRARRSRSAIETNTRLARASKMN